MSERSPQTKEHEIPLTPEQIRARIDAIDREIVTLTTTTHLSEIPEKNELGPEQEEDALEGAENFRDFSFQEERVKHLRGEKAELQKRLDTLSKA